MIDPAIATIASLTYLTKGITKPVADELGEMLANHFKSWKATNLLKILVKANGKLALSQDGKLILNPKILFKIAENGSLESESDIQEMWAGLIVSSTDADEGILYVEILTSLSKGQAMILQETCKNAKVSLSPNGLIYSSLTQFPTTESMKKTYGSKDIHSLDQALDDLRRKGLIDGGFDIYSDNNSFRLLPTPLALHFFARVSGYNDSVKFFKLHKKKSKSLKQKSEVVRDK